MGNGVCNCSKGDQHDSNMHEIAQREESISLYDKLHDRKSFNKDKTDTVRINPSPLLHELQEEGKQTDISSQELIDKTPKTNDTEIEEQVFIINCTSIRECEAVKRISTCLVFYETLNIKSYSRLINYFDDKNYPFLLEDYNHILYQHIGDETRSISQSRQQFEFIHAVILQSIKKCNINKCDKWKRNNRLREKHGVIDNINNMNNNKLLKYYIETMDMIHCFFVHSFHCGYRLKISELNETRRKPKRARNKSQRKKRKSEEIEDDNDDYMRQLTTIAEETKSQCDLECDDETKLYIDEQLQEIKTKLINKKKKLENIRGINRCKNNKFITKIPKYIQNSNKLQSENDKNNSEQHKMNIFGHRYYYWQYYKQSMDRDIIPNDGYRINQWYIEKKYDDLEEEIHDNNIYKLEYERFKEIVFMANQKIQCQYARNLIADGFVTDKYGIAYKQQISVKHLQAILIYTHFDELSNIFRDSFIRKQENETDDILKQRASEFWHFSKLLRETVDVFGVDMEHSKIDIFYHNIDYKFPFKSTMLYLAVPISTTIHLEVATIYSNDNGIMLEMEKDDDMLRYFDCQWLSCTANDGERLFVGAPYGVRLKSIREIASNINYQYFMHAISIFDVSISAKIPHSDATRTDLQIIATLVNNRRDLAEEYNDDDNINKHDTNQHDEYINNIFYDFCCNKHEINISIWNMNRYYSSMQLLLFHNKSKNKYLCVFSNLCKIFKNCKKISIEYYEFDKPELNESFFDLLLDELQNIPKQNKTNLIIQLIQVKYTQNILERFKREFIAKSWFIEESEGSKISIYKMSMDMLSQK